MSTKSSFSSKPIVGDLPQNIRTGARPKTFAESKAEVDARLAAELQRRTEQYEAEQRAALGL